MLKLVWTLKNSFAGERHCVDIEENSSNCDIYIICQLDSIEFGHRHFSLPNSQQGMTLSRLKNILEPDLLGEILLDLVTIFGPLFLAYKAGLLMLIWLCLVSSAGSDPHLFFVLGNVFVLLVSYWLPASLYTFVDYFRPAFLYRYVLRSEMKTTSGTELNFIALYQSWSSWK